MTAMQMGEATIMARKAQRRGVAQVVAAPSARPKLVDAVVDSPTVPGAVERLKRVVDTIETMHKRRQLGCSKDEILRAVENERGYRAAIRLRSAHAILYGSIGGAMDFDRVRGGGTTGAPPPMPYMEAAEVMRVSKQKLRALDYRVLQVVVCDGHTIEEASEKIRGNAERANREDIGAALRRGLFDLAEMWFEPLTIKRRRVRPYHAPDADPRAVRYSAQVGTIERGKTVTATRNRIHRN